MKHNIDEPKLLIVDDEADFRLAVSQGLSRRGFLVLEAADGEEALRMIIRGRPDVVLLDLKMPGLSGIETLKRIRDVEPFLPVIILTGHGDYEAALAGIKLEIIDFVHKPADIDQLAKRIRILIEKGGQVPMAEPTIEDLMAPPSIYPRVYINDSVASVLKVIYDGYTKGVPEGSKFGQVRSALIFDRNEKFVGMVRFSTLLDLMIPPFLNDSAYASYFTGMFLAQTKVFGKQNIAGLVKKQITVDVKAPLMEAIHLLVENRLINIPVMCNGELVGILRGRDIIIESARLAGSL